MSANDNLNGQQFSTEDVEWHNSTSLDPDDHGDVDFAKAVWHLQDIPLARIHGRYGTYQTYNDEVPGYMDALAEAHQRGELPPAAFVERSGRYYHADGAHRVVVARHLGETHLRSFVTRPNR